MSPKYHILIGIIFCSILYFFFHLSLFEISLVFLSSILIDIDHYFYYIYHKKDFSLKNAYNFFINAERKWFSSSPEERKKYKTIVIIFHGIEFILLMFFFSLIYHPVFFVFFGLIFHLIIDLIDLFFHKEQLFYKISQIYILVKNKNKKKFI